MAIPRGGEKFGVGKNDEPTKAIIAGDPKCRICKRPWGEHAGWDCYYDPDGRIGTMSDAEAAKRYGYVDEEKEGQRTMAEVKKLDREMARGGPATIERGGKVITLPDGMSYDAAIEWLNRRKAEDTREVSVYHEFERVYPLDALVAFHRALAAIYNWVDSVPSPGFFGPKPPTMVNVRTGPHAVTSVPWGAVQVPGIDGTLNTGLNEHNLFIGGTVRQGSMDKVREIMLKTEDILRTASIYRGKAVKATWAWERDDEKFNIMRDCPHFMDFEGASEADLVFSEDVQRALDVGLWAPIEFADACRRHGVPLKRGVLLEGPYGVGKTLAALVTALKATKHGWTFVYLDSVLDLRNGLRLAQQYAPAVVFAEDIDRVVSGERSAEMDEMLNCLDGVDTKHHEIITVLTTNHVESINQAILRPGRLDTVVSVRPPDAAAAGRLVTLYGRGLIARDADIELIGATLAGKIPAIIREAVERAKIAAVARLRGQDIRGHVTEADLAAAAASLEAHAALLAPKPAPERRMKLRHLDVVVDGTVAE